MNETIKNLIERRSCRKYKSKQIKDEELNLILKAGEYAPSGMGMQSPKMVVLQNKSMIERLSKLNAKIMNRDVDPFYGAPTVIVVLADKTKMTYNPQFTIGKQYKIPKASKTTEIFASNHKNGKYEQ